MRRENLARTRLLAAVRQRARAFFIVLLIILLCFEGVTGHFHGAGFPFPLLFPLAPILMARLAAMEYFGLAGMSRLLRRCLVMMSFVMGMHLALASMMEQVWWRRRWLPPSASAAEEARSLTMTA